MQSVLKIFVSKLDTNVDLPWSTMSDEAKENAVVIGAGRILNDAHAGVKRANYPTGEAGTAQFKDAVLTAVKTRLHNLVNGDVRSGNAAVAVLTAERDAEKAARLAADARTAELEKQLAELMAAQGKKPGRAA